VPIFFNGKKYRTLTKEEDLKRVKDFSEDLVFARTGDLHGLRTGVILSTGFLHVVSD